MDIDRFRAIRAFNSLGFTEAGDYLGDYRQEEPFAGLEGGTVTVEEFHSKLHSLMPASVTDEDIDRAFTRFLIGIPVERLHALRRLRSQYRVYILSNTNPIMWNGFIAREFAKDGHSLDYYVEGAITSFEARCMKPDRQIFDYTAKKLDIKPAETMFFDDSQANCEAARSLGWNVAHVPAHAEFMDICRNLDLI